MTEQAMGTCNKCCEKYPVTPIGNVHKCGKCSEGMIVPDHLSTFITLPNSVVTSSAMISPNVEQFTQILQRPATFLSDKDVAGVLELNSPLMTKIDSIVTAAAVNFADRRDAGSSSSMNGALDYTASIIMSEIRAALKVS